MHIIKFGGTALLNKELLSNALNIIKSFPFPLIIVVSAIGRKGFPYASDTLLNSIETSFISLKEDDRLMSIGEIYASIYLSSFLNKNHIKSYALSYLENGIITDETYTNGHIISLNDSSIKSLLNEYQVLIIPGFIGTTKEHEIITLGRGASDLSAILVALMLKEKEIILYKDVEGIYPCFPHSNLPYYCYLSYEEAIALSHIGYQIINLKALEVAKIHQITIKVFFLKDNTLKTTISSLPSNKDLLGYYFDYNIIKCATFNPLKLKNQLNQILSNKHLFIKEEVIEKNIYSFKININQTFQFKKILNDIFLERVT
jgi:aspartate kinase